MGRTAMQPKFVPVNLNKSYGEGISPSPPSSSSPPSSFGPASRRARPHGGMVLLTRPSRSSSSSSLSMNQTPKVGTPCLRNLQKENAANASGVALIGASGTSVWNRQQAPIASSTDLAFPHASPATITTGSLLGPSLSHVNENGLLDEDGRLPLMPCTYESNASMRTPPLGVSNKHNPTPATRRCLERVAVLREEDFPSLQISGTLLSSNSQQVQRGMQQKQQGQLLGQDQQKKPLQLSHQQTLLCESRGEQLSFTQHHLCLHTQPAQALQTTVPIKGPSTVPNYDVWSMSRDEVAKGKPGTPVAICDESWVDDERETLCQGSTATERIEEFPDSQEKGLWRWALDVKDQASKWDDWFEVATRGRNFSLVPEHLSGPFSLSKDRESLFHNNATDFGICRNASYKSDALDRNHTQHNTWHLDKLRRSFVYATSNLCVAAKERCLQGIASGSFVQRTLEHPFSRSFLGNPRPDFCSECISGLDLKARRRKKEKVEAVEYRDFARESFEAELERVQEILEQERILVADGQEEASKLARMEQEQKRHLVEKELQLQLEEDTRKAAESAERKAKEVTKKVGGAWSAREEERKKMFLEEEKRKERATKKLLELEERIARREEECIARCETEKGLMTDGSLHSSVSACEQRVQSELVLAIDRSPTQEQLHQLQQRPIDDADVTGLPSVNKGSLECSGMSGCKTTGQKLASSSTPCSLQDVAKASAVSQRLPEESQVSPPPGKTEALKVHNLFPPLYPHDKDILLGIETRDNDGKETPENIKHWACSNMKDVSHDDDGKETPENIKHGVCSNMKDVPHGVQFSEQLQVVQSKNGSLVSDSYHQACDELKEEAPTYDSKGGTQQKKACKHSQLSSVTESGDGWFEQGEEHKLVELSTGGDSTGEKLLEVGYADPQTSEVLNVETVSDTACEHSKWKARDNDYGEIEDFAKREGFHKPFNEVLPDTVKKAVEGTKSGLKSSFQETREGTKNGSKSSFQETREELVVHQALQQPSILLLHGDRTVEVKHHDAFSSQQLFVQGLTQPFSCTPIPLSEASSFLAPADDFQNKQEASFQLPLGLCSAAPFMLHAIQVGSIQMPLTSTDTWMLQLPPLHGSQASLLQFGQLCSTSTDQLLSTIQSTLPEDYAVEQAPKHCQVDAEACIQQGAKLVENWDQIFKAAEESPLLNGNGPAWQAASLRAPMIKFGQLFSSILYKPFSTGQSLSNLVHANKKPSQHEVQTKSLILEGLASNGLEKLDQLFHSAEQSLVSNVSGQLPCDKAFMMRYGYNECALAPEFSLKPCDQALLVSQEGEKKQLRRNENFHSVQSCPAEKPMSFTSGMKESGFSGHYSAFSRGRKKKGNITTCTGVLERKYWRMSTIKTKYIEASHPMMEKNFPGLGVYNRPLRQNPGRFVYRKKELPGINDEKLQTDKKTAQGFCTDPPIDTLQNQEFKKVGTSQREPAAVSINNNLDTTHDLLYSRMLKEQRFVAAEDVPMQYGTVCVFEQQEMDIPCTVDDFIEVKSRRQVLRKHRK